MILFQSKNTIDKPVNDKIKLIHDKDEIMELARDLFARDKTLRKQAIPVLDYDMKSVLYYLTWQSNMDEIPDEGFSSYIHFYASEEWDYIYTDDRMDFNLIERGDVFIFEQLEEYTYAITKILQIYYPDKYIFFYDKAVSYFFEESEHLHVIDGKADIFNKYKFILAKSIFFVRTDQIGIRPHARKEFLQNKFTSIEIMTSLYWTTDVVSYGEKNPDKTFFLMNSALGMMGLSDMIRFRLFSAEVVSSHNHNHIIPVVDLSVKGDHNQFNGGDGRNAWTMFFEQLTDIPLEEVYQSKNVIRGADQLFYSNPYIKEQSYFGDLPYLFNKYLRYNEKTKAFVDDMTSKIIPAGEHRILGVIGRGTDYNQSTVKNILHAPTGPQELLENVKQLLEEQNYEYVFLATEDKNVFSTFMESSIGKRVLSVPQDRVEYNPTEDKLLVELYKNRSETGFIDTVRYISIVDILSKCTSLVASTDCGAYLLAIGLNNHKYEYVKVYTDKEVLRQ